MNGVRQPYDNRDCIDRFKTVRLSAKNYSTRTIELRRIYKTARK